MSDLAHVHLCMACIVRISQVQDWCAAGFSTVASVGADHLLSAEQKVVVYSLVI